MFAETLGIEKIPILLVEDRRSEAMTTERQLRAVDDEFSVSRVSRLEEALERISQHRVDAVLLDLGLPDSDGPQAIQRLNSQFPDLPIVVLSGRDDMATIHSALEYGAQGFLSKRESSGRVIRQAILGAIIRKSLAQ